jgi:hypothetical protein
MCLHLIHGAKRTGLFINSPKDSIPLMLTGYLSLTNLFILKAGEHYF